MRGEAVYRSLLLILPPAFRREAQEELVETFRAAHARLSGAGLRARARFWLLLAIDLVVTLAAELRPGRPGPAGASLPPPHPRPSMEPFRHVRAAVRSLLARRAYATTALVTIALGIGSSVAIFSVVNAVLLKPLPYADPDRLVLVWQELRARNVPEFPFPTGDIPDLREKGTLFESVATLQTGQQIWRPEGEEGRQISSAFVSHNFFAVLGLPVLHGRDFTAEDGAAPPPPPQNPMPGTPPPVFPPFSLILSHAWWQQEFGGRLDVLGRSIAFDGPTGIVVGIAPPGAELHFAARQNIERAPDVWIATRTNFATGSRTAAAQRVIARLQPGVALAQAQGQMDALAAELRATYPVKENAGVHINVVPMHASLVSDVRVAILALMGAVIFVLLIACANVANLTLSQGLGRERELSVRHALGASRATLVRQMFVESLLLATAGATLGVGLARLGIEVLRAIGPSNLPRLGTVGVDWTVVLFAAAAALVSAVLFGLVPALRASRPNPADVLRQGGRTATASGGRTAGALVVAEVALTFVLLVGAGLMLQSLVSLHRVRPGYDPEGILMFRSANVGLGARSAEERRDIVGRLRTALSALPGVEGVSAASPLPLDGSSANMPWGTEAALADPTAFQQAAVHTVQPGYFETMRTPVLAGRVYDDRDDPSTNATVVVDERLAARAYPGESAVGRPLLLRVGGNAPTRFEIIGVVAHQRHASLATDGREALFLLDGRPGSGLASRWIVRTSQDPAAIAGVVRAEVARVAPGLVLSEVQPMTALVERAQAPTRFALVLIATFAVVAVVLALVGLYGVLSTAVRHRTAEIGVRLAFGAERAAIFRSVVGRGLGVAAAGVALGVAGALAATRTIQSLLVGVEAADPVVFTTIAMLFLAVATVACGLPAWRASRLDPVRALREG